ncbi:OLC1v1024268C1, partial [Oldenlandia corymbosa var. corymbosa]
TRRLLVHHAIALGLHTTTLILVKGALDACGSKLMPDKKDFGYSFPCDSPGRGGTCDISAWDPAFGLVFFAMFLMFGTFHTSWLFFLPLLVKGHKGYLFMKRYRGLWPQPYTSPPFCTYLTLFRTCQPSSLRHLIRDQWRHSITRFPLI